MNAERSRATLILMEQVIMILVFSIAASFCIQAFVTSNLISKESQEKDKAAHFAQNISEVLKESCGDMTELLKTYGGTIDADEWTLVLDKEWKESDTFDYVICVQKKNTSTYLSEALITIENNKQETVYEQKVAWQEVN